MRLNLCLYLPQVNADVRTVFPEARRLEGSFAIPFRSATLKLNSMPETDLGEHLSGFLAYIESLAEPKEAKAEAAGIVRSTKTVLGLVTDLELRGNEDVPAFLGAILERFGGCMFAYDSVIRSDGEILVGPLKDHTE